jgi:hypothetical protein
MVLAFPLVKGREDDLRALRLWRKDVEMDKHP